MQPDHSTARDNDRLRRFYNRSAADYDTWMRHYDRTLLGDGRQRVCARARGHTLEVGVGAGLNLAYYPRDVTLTAFDLTPGMLEIAAQRARRLGREVTFQRCDAHALPFPDNHFDTVVATLLLSTISDCRRATAEAWRVLQPGGQLLLLDHVRGPVAPVRWAERLLDPLLARCASVHLLRNPLDYLGAAGFIVEHCARSH